MGSLNCTCESEPDKTVVVESLGQNKVFQPTTLSTITSLPNSKFSSVIPLQEISSSVLSV